MSTRYLEVRCCCTPVRLYGWLPVAEDLSEKPSTPVIFPTQGPYEDRVGLTIRTARQSHERLESDGGVIRYEAEYKALCFDGNSEDPGTKRQLLSRVPGFIPYPDLDGRYEEPGSLHPATPINNKR